MKERSPAGFLMLKSKLVIVGDTEVDRGRERKEDRERALPI